MSRNNIRTIQRRMGEHFVYGDSASVPVEKGSRLYKAIVRSLEQQGYTPAAIENMIKNHGAAKMSSTFWKKYHAGEFD